MAKIQFSEEQIKASDPNKNIWVQANAGTGKTTVLVHRILRILFNSVLKNEYTGILCLTYTNAAANEMKQRTLEELQKWVKLSENDLKEELKSFIKSPNDLDVLSARKVFYKYIDNQDILKIKTIHGFCEEILRKFAIEAGISPIFKILQNYEQKLLLKRAFSDLINLNFKKNQQIQNLNNAFERVLEIYSENNLDELLEILEKHIKEFKNVNFIKYRKYFIDKTKELLNINKTLDKSFSKERLNNIIKMAENEQTSLKKPPIYLDNIIIKTKQYIDNTISFEDYKTLYLTDTNEKSKLIKKEFLYEEQDRVYNLVQYSLNEEIYKNTISLFDLSYSFYEVYLALKQSENYLDFDDLIFYTKKLFQDSSVMGYILSNLDNSISHILIDEAQDTSPEQWEIIKLLSEDFLSPNKSIFVVADTKQSIYGFQGADPNKFLSSKTKIKQMLENSQLELTNISLKDSFRYINAISNTVNYLFNTEKVKEISNFVNDKHISTKNENGFVEIYKVFTKEINNK